MEITQVMAADKAAREQVKAARAAARAIDDQTPVKVQALRDELTRKAQEKVDAFEQQQAGAARARIAKAGQQTKDRRQRLDDRYREQGDRWVAHIVAKVTEV